MKDGIEILRGLSRCEDKEQMARYLESIEESKSADNGGTFAKDTNVLTNADRIRTMSDEELARVLYSLVNLDDEIPYCKNLPECETFLDGGGIPERKCVQCLAEWLRQPAEVKT